MTESCSAIILAGGQSRRMGRPKAWLDFHGRPLLTHMVELLSARFEDIVVVAAPGQDLPENAVRVVRDEAPGMGPVGGLATGLKAVRGPFAFVTAVDAPLLRVSLVELLLANIDEADLCVPEWEGRLQPLCALYRSDTVCPVLEEQLAHDRRRLMDALARLKVRTLGQNLLRTVDPSGQSFLAVNTPEEYAHALFLMPSPLMHRE